MAEAEHPQEKALTGRSCLVALCMVLLWTVGGCYMAVYGGLYIQQLLMILGFGAILTIFLLQFPLMFLISLGLLWGGTYALMYVSAGAADKARILTGILRSLPVMLPLLALGLWLKRKPLRRAELVVVYACVLIAIPWCITIKAVIESSTANLFELQRRSEPQLYAWSRDMPWWGPTVPPRRLEAEDKPPPPPAAVDAPTQPTPATQGAAAAAPPGNQPAAAPRKPKSTPEDEESLAAIRGFALGNGGRVPWKLWWRPIVFWTGMCLAFESMLMGLLMLFRRRWIEHERLPFVWSQPALQILSGPAERRVNRRRWLLFAAGLGICLPAITLIGPAGEALSSWSIPPWVGQEGFRGGFDLTALNILPRTPLKLFWGPLVLAMLLLFPVDVLMTTALTFIFINMLLPGLMRSFGLEVGPSRLGEFVKWGMRFGGCAGLFLWSAVFAIWDWIRRPAGRNQKSKADDGLPQSLFVVLFVGGLVAFLALGCYSTTAIQMACLTGFVLIYAFAQVRQRAEGQPLTYDNNIASHQMVSIQRDFLRDHYNLGAKTPSSWATHWLQWGFSGQLKSYGPHNMLLEAFKVAHELKVHARPVAKAIGMTMLVVALVTPLLYIQLMYIYGFDNSYQGALANWASFTQWSERGASYGMNSTSKVFWMPADSFYDQYRNVFNTIYGVLIIGILFYLRREYPRFPFSPVGVVLAAELWRQLSVPFSPENIWFTFLAAWIIKSLIFRWLGVRSFREKVQPAVIMLLIGMIYGMMMYMCRYLALGLGRLK